MTDHEEYHPPKRLRLLIIAVVVGLTLLAFALSWLTMPRTPQNAPPQASHAPSVPQ
ncbi:MAG: hypothetical protein ACRD1I_05120 [Terriglobia bacterium]